jgi:phage regulator Rha-like protein
MESDLEPVLSIEDMIHEIRGQKVMLDRDLARLYGVETKMLNRAVKRNISRFPEFFMFQLTAEEWQNLRCQIGTFKSDIRKYRPYAFTEHGILMLSSVLNSERAVQINIQIMLAFVQMRRYMLEQSDTTAQIAGLRKLLMLYIEKNDKRVDDIVRVLNCLAAAPPKSEKVIGFRAERGHA